MLCFCMEEPRTFVDWTEDEVLQWLLKLDLTNDYSERFRGRKITGASLLQLNPEALDSLNITDGADRLKIIQSVTTMRADLLVSAASSGRNTLSRNHSSEGTVTTTRARNFSEGMIKRFPNTQRVIRRQPRVDGHDASSPTQLMKPYNLISLDEGDDRRQIESMLTLRAHNKKKYLSRSMDGLLKDGGLQITGTLNGSSRLVEVLKQENFSLKKELETYYQKVRKLLKLEQEVEHVRDAYRLLESSNQKRERLEAAVRSRLEDDLKRLRESQQIGSGANETSSPKKKTGVKKEIARRDTMIMKLIKQNKDQVLYREQLEKDLISAKVALQERVVENVPTPNSNQLSTEISSYSTQYAESIEKLKSVLEAMQKSSQKRENLEKRLRQQLEAEVGRLKATAIGQRSVATGDVQSDIRVCTLESDVARWEQRCLELVAEKQMALEAATIPRDSRIAQLERALAQKSDLAEELKRQKTNYATQLQEANKALSEMEVRCASMQAALAEKDSVIQMLQQSFLEPDSSPPDDSLLTSLDSPGLDKKLSYGSRSRSSSQHSLTSNSSKSSGDMLDPSPIGRRKVSQEVASPHGENRGGSGRIVEVGQSPPSHHQIHSEKPTSHVKQHLAPPTQPLPPFVHSDSPLVVVKHPQSIAMETTPKRVALPAVVYSEVGSGRGLASSGFSPVSNQKSKSKTPPMAQHVSAAWENEDVANGLGTTHVQHTSLLGSHNSVEFIESLFHDTNTGGSPAPVHVYSHSVPTCPV